MIRTDVVIVGGGMAGASLGAALVADRSVTIIEMETMAGYHATGRSVAFWQESYGGPGVQPLTTASGPMMLHPDPGFSDHPFLSPRGALHIGRPGSERTRAAMLARFAGSGVSLASVDGCALASVIPGLREEWTVGLREPSCMDIDATGLHMAYLAAFRRGGGQLLTQARLCSAAREGTGWRIETSAGPLACDILVNAAGAWADEVARICQVKPVGIQPFRRTVVQLRTDPAPAADLPLVMDMEGGFYFKPTGDGRVWLTPHDETPSLPCDAAPEEMAVAQAIERFQQVIDWRVEAVERKWAGLRSFAPDRLPVLGFDVGHPGFFWCAGQGGFGIQTAPAIAKLGAALLTGAPRDAAVASIDASRYAADRFERD